MANRNYLKIIEATKSKLNPHYEMKLHEWAELSTKAEKDPDPCEAIADAFVLGYAMGQRALKAANKKPCQCANTNRASRKPTTERA